MPFGAYSQKESYDLLHDVPSYTRYELSDGPYILTGDQVKSTEVFNPPGTTYDPPLVKEYRRYYKRTNGVKISDFNRRRREGQLLPLTEFTQYEESFLTTPGTLVQTYDDGNALNKVILTFSPQLNLGALHASLWESAELSVLGNLPDASAFRYDVQKAASKIYARGHDTATFLAEVAKTRRMFINLIKNIASLKLPKSAKSFANAWAEARYGWRTLAFDLRDLQEAVSLLESNKKRYLERAGHSFSFTNVSYDSAVDGVGVTFNGTLTERWEVSVRGTVAADISPPAFSFNSAVTAWEILPWSFVIDWLVNVGLAISAMSFLVFNSHYEAAGGFYINLDRTYKRTTEDPSPANSWTTSGQLGSQRVKATLNKRIPTTVSSIPQIRLRLDEFKVLDLVSFLYQRR